MKYLGKITDSKDLVTKEYVDNSIPAAASTAPAMSSDTAAIGSSMNFARADHVHPSDTSKAGVTLKVWVAGVEVE